MPSFSLFFFLLQPPAPIVPSPPPPPHATMPSINNYFIFTSLALSALTLATPLGLRSVGQPGTALERLLVRAPEPAPVAVPVVAARTIPRRDSSNCKAPEASPSSTPASSSDHSPSKASSSDGEHTGEGKLLIPTPPCITWHRGLTCYYEGTYYTPGLGACGETSSSSQHIVAVSKLLYDSYPYVIPHRRPHVPCSR